MIVTSHTDDKIRTWDLSSHAYKKAVEGHTSPIQGLCAGFGKFYSASFDGSLVSWNYQAEVEQVIEGPHGLIAMTIYDEYRLCCVYIDNMLRLWNLDSGECEKMIHLQAPCSYVAVFGSFVLVGEASKSTVCMIHVIDLEAQAIKQSFDGHSKSVTCLLKRDEYSFWSAGADGKIILWEIETGKHTEFSGHTDEITAIQILDEDRLVSASLDHTMRIWDVKEAKCIQVIPVLVPVIALCADEKLYSGDENGTISIYDKATMDVELSLHSKRQIAHLCISRANNFTKNE